MNLSLFHRKMQVGAFEKKKKISFLPEENFIEISRHRVLEDFDDFLMTKNQRRRMSLYNWK